MANRGEVLVAIINDNRDFKIAREKGWYRIPVASANRFLKDRWPPSWLTFYQTKVFEEEAFSVRYFARVRHINEVYRQELFPNEPPHARDNWKYYKIHLDELKQLEQPIYSRRLRRIVFIPTTWQKFNAAVEINDLYDESPLEDRLWAIFKQHQIPAERQLFYSADGENYFLDFATLCAEGNIVVEADGDTYHSNPEKSIEDNIRNNTLVANGWKVFHFTTKQIEEQAETYCVSKVTEAINKLGGIDDGKYMPRKINLNASGSYQLGLFDEFGEV